MELFRFFKIIEIDFLKFILQIFCLYEYSRPPNWKLHMMKFVYKPLQKKF